MPQAGLSVRRADTPSAEPLRDVTAEPSVPRAGVPGRRTVTIRGRGAERYTPSPRRRRPARRPHERAGFKPDRIAMWAVLLGILLVLVAATSSHAAAMGAHAQSVVHALIASR